MAIAKGSAGEVRSQLYRAFDQQYFSPTEFDMLLETLLKISGGLANFMTYLKNSDLKGTKFKEPEVPYHSDPFDPLNPLNFEP